MEIERVARRANLCRRIIINDRQFHHLFPRQMNIYGYICVALLVCFLAVAYVGYIEIVYHRGSVKIEDIKIDNFRVNYTLDNTTRVALGGNTTLEVFFKTKGNAERFFGDFNISSIAFPNNPIKSFSQHTSTTQEGEKDVVIVRFDTHATILTPEELRVFKELLADNNGDFWILLSVKYAWNVKQEKYYYKSPRVRYVRYSCQIPYKAFTATNSNPTRCVK